MQPTPKGWPRISTALFYQDPARAIDWLCRAFGFEVRMKVEGDGGAIVHSELTFGDGLIMVGGGISERQPDRAFGASPRALGGANTQHLCVYVDDVEAHHARAVAAGAKITRPLSVSDYGEDYWSDRTYRVEDLEGHQWWFMQRVATRGKPA